MSTPEFKLDINAPTVNLVDPKNGGESASTVHFFLASDERMVPFMLLLFMILYILVHFCLWVKSLYVKNLPKTVTQE